MTKAPAPSCKTSVPHRSNRIRDRDRAAGHVGVQTFDHLAVEPDRAARGVFRLFEGGDDLAGLRDLFFRRREDRVAGFDLAGMDQRLAIETEIAALGAFRGKTIDVAKIAVGPIENLARARVPPECNA